MKKKPASKKKIKVMSIFGTRPEAVKLAPVIRELERRGANHVVCVTGQHRKLLDQMLDFFGIETHYDLGIMTRRQTLEQISSKVLLGMERIFEKERPDVILVQGDTTTALIAALAAYYKQVPRIGHVEAGLRTDNKFIPFPEEMNRRLITRLSDIHFAATPRAYGNLIAEGISAANIFITGNPVIDSLFWVLEQKKPFISTTLRRLRLEGREVVLVTTHRRENVGKGMESIFKAIKKLAAEHPELLFVFPVHPNPLIKKLARQFFAALKNVRLTEPLDYSDLAALMQKAHFIMTDSGGIQEEAPSLGKPVLVLRDVTERTEGVEAGTLELVGTDTKRIYTAAKELLTNRKKYEAMAKAKNPYGDGTAAQKIVDLLMSSA